MPVSGAAGFDAAVPCCFSVGILAMTSVAVACALVFVFVLVLCVVWRLDHGWPFLLLGGLLASACMSHSHHLWRQTWLHAVTGKKLAVGGKWGNLPHDGT